MWAKFDDNFPDHPKVVGLSDAAFRAFVGSVCYCARQLTDGVLPGGAARKLARTQKVLAELVSGGLWEPLGPAHDYLVHDYLEYNPTKEKVLAERQEGHEAKVRAGKLGAAKRWLGHSKANGRTIAARIADPIADAQQNPQQSDSKTAAPYPYPSLVPAIQKKSSRRTTTSLDNGARAELVVVVPLLRAFEQSFGRMLSPMEIESIKHLEDEHPRERIDYALREAADLGKRVVRYVQRVCESQETRGDDRGERERLGRNGGSAQAPIDAATAIRLAYPGIRTWDEPEPGGADGGVAPLDGDDDQAGLEVRR